MDRGEGLLPVGLEAESFLQLFLVRLGVAIGEVGGFISGFSLLYGYFVRAERPLPWISTGSGAALSLHLGYLDRLYW